MAGPFCPHCGASLTGMGLIEAEDADDDDEEARCNEEDQSYEDDGDR